MRAAKLLRLATASLLFFLAVYVGQYQMAFNRPFIDPHRPAQPYYYGYMAYTDQRDYVVIAVSILLATAAVWLAATAFRPIDLRAVLRTLVGL